MSGRAETRSAIVLVRHPDPGDAVVRLAERGIIVDSRPGVVRVSPHFYNTVDEVEEFVEGLRGTVRAAALDRRMQYDHGHNHGHYKS